MGRLVLPLFDQLAKRRPSVDAVREQLGGRAESQPGIGRIVRLETTSPSPSDRFGVVLFVDQSEFLAVTEQGIVHRILREGAVVVDPSEVTEARALLALAADANVFATLAEGQSVRFLDERTGPTRAVLVERCRFGVIVQRDDGVLMGVGFRKVWPAQESGGALS